MHLTKSILLLLPPIAEVFSSALFVAPRARVRTFLILGVTSLSLLHFLHTFA